MANRIIKTRELKHYGVLGMKWGVRKEDLNKIRTNGGKVAAGTRFSRLSTVEKESNKGRAYVSESNSAANNDAQTKQMYITYIRNKAFGKLSEDEAAKRLAEYNKNGINPIPIYQTDMQLKTDLILPSMKEKGKIFCDKFLNSEKGRNQIVAAYEKERRSLYNKDSQYIIDERMKRVKADMEEAVKVVKKDGFQLNDDGTLTSMDSIKNIAVSGAYVTFLGALNNDKVMSLYTSELKKQGFNAVSDDLDIMDAKTMTMRSNLNEVIDRGQSRFFGPNKQDMEDYQALRNPENRKYFTGSGMIILERENTLEVLETRRVV